MKKWLILTASCLGILALCAIIWWVLPIVSVAGVQPFASVWLRLALVMFIITIFAGFQAWKYYRQRKASAALASELAKAPVEEQSSDAKQLAEKMADAIATLRKSRKTRGDVLYELPWYIIIGPPGAGKTTALVNSGLKFPLAGATEKRPVSGVGGTRYCDWWFTEDAVLIDTAGRYTTLDSDAGADKRSWLAFLDLLKKNRQLQPINGVMIAISLADIMSLPEAELMSHSSAIRSRLNELHGHLKIDFPVYVNFTKADLVSGFTEFFSNLGEARRKMVWGATFQVKSKSENRINDVGAEFDLLMERLSEEMADRLQEEVDPFARVAIFGFPSQMAGLRRPITQFLDDIFEPTRYQTNVPLRGFYFTSGTQEGTPIDRLLGSMAGLFGSAPQAAPAFAGRGKSYFIGDLLTKVIFAEAGWVSSSRAAVQRKAALAYAGYGAVAIASAVILGLWWTSYLYNSNLVYATSIAVENYKPVASPIIQEQVVADGDFTKPLNLLHIMRNLPAGYETRDEPTPIGGTFGLSQRERLLSAASAAYRAALDRTLRPRLIYYVEHQLEQNQNQADFIYEALKVYLMLSKDENVPVDKALVLNWFAEEWDKSAARGNAAAKNEFLRHIDAMLELDDGGGVMVSLNGALVERSRATIARLSLADRAYTFLKSIAESDPVPDWVAADHGGPDMATVFEARDVPDLGSVRVSKFYTYHGFHTLFLDRIGAVVDQLNSERWVLGNIGQQNAVKAQQKVLGVNLLSRYSTDFIRAWSRALGQVKLKSLASDTTNYAVLQAISAPTSPLKMLLESISRETKLTEAPPEEAAAEAAGSGSGVTDAATSVIRQRLESRATGFARIGIEIARKSQLRAGGTTAAAQVPGQTVEDAFRRFHEFMDTSSGEQPIQKLLDNLNGIYENLMLARTDPVNSASAAQTVQQMVSALRSQNANRLPSPFDRMMYDAANQFETEAANATVQDLTAQLQQELTQKCREITANRFPFAPQSKREVPWVEFGKLFGGGGIIDRFFAVKLDGMVDQTGEQWKWSEKTRVSRELSLSALKQFQNAAKIRNAFFPQGGIVPNVALTIAPISMSSNATNAEFEINGEKLEHAFGIDTPKNFQWPGSSLNEGTASVAIFPEIMGGNWGIGYKGAWSLYRLFQRGSMSQSGDQLTVRFVIGGREVAYQVKVGSPDNPFTLPALRGFQCPDSL
jgi:type VI secretion system protein ImpL